MSRNYFYVFSLLLILREAWAFVSTNGVGATYRNSNPIVSATKDDNASDLRTLSIESNDSRLYQFGKESFLLPIFPLRKRVRFPTDTLMLNLYEERYLAMSEFVLQSEKGFTPQIMERYYCTADSKISRIPAPFFGAIYSSDKPQLVAKGGAAPITPILSKGDVGVICLVQDWLDGMIPTRGSNRNANVFESDNLEDKTEEPTKSLRRRIRLNALAVGRFQITKIVQEAPYIVVEAQALADDGEMKYDTTRFEGLRGELQSVLRETDDQTNSAQATAASAKGDALTAFSTTNSLDAVDQISAMVEFVGTQDNTQQQQRDELLSFLAVSTLTDGATNISRADLSKMLQTQSLQQRMNLLQFYKKW